MAFLSASARRHFRALMHSPDQLCIPHIPCVRSITSGRPRIPPSFPAPPPARRHYEHIPPTPTPTDASHPEVPRRPTNRQIPFSHVYVLDPSTNALSRTKHSLKELLATHTPERRIVELVASTPKPIVRVTTRSEIEGRYREMRRAARKGARQGEAPKEVQLTWGVAWADVEHKLRKARQDLEKGYRVVVVVKMKYRHRPSSHEELLAFADDISEALGEVGEEWKEREIAERLMVLSFRKAGVDDDTP